MTERTFSIIKPDATRRNLTGAINAVIEGAGLRIVAQRRVKLTEAQAKKFYEVHAERPFYGELVGQMTAEPVVVQVLEGEDAVKRNRDVMGATNPADAAEGTIRKAYAESIEANSVHGSDSLENAAREIAREYLSHDVVLGEGARLFPPGTVPNRFEAIERSIVCHGALRTEEMAALLVAVAAFTLVWAYLITVRLRVGRLEERAATQALSARTGRPRSNGQLPPVADVQERARSDA